MNFQEAIAAAWAKIDGLIDGFILILPNMVLAAIVFIAFFFAARWSKAFVKRLTRKHRQARNLGLVLGRLAQGTVILIGLFVALSIVIPTFRAGDIAKAIKERKILLRHAEMVKQDSQQAIAEELDKKDIEERYWAIKRELLAK
ncbi:MAG: hypothetical protein KME17_09685 [Cyanosarcina radialis HA8281-LM2]|jgi:cellobiose-specific phosphotransferase system component IIC|nr:hypothetical protein [Cyanosarcina radialis HA8281-LM2]